MSKKYSQLVEAFKAAPKTPKTKVSLREAYLTNNNMFQIGSLVETNEGEIAEVLDRGTNYLTLIKEGKTFKKWLTDVKQVSEQDTSKRRTQVYKESFIIKGYKTKHFTRELAEQFRDVAKQVQDTHALYNATVSLDMLLTINEGIDSDRYYDLKVAYDCVNKYCAKFGIKIEEMGAIEDSLLEYSLLEGLKFSAADKMKIASIIATTAGIASEGSIEDIVNRSALKFKTGRHTEEGWKLIGKMMNKATQAGIKWDKNIFNRAIWRPMGLE